MKSPAPSARTGGQPSAAAFADAAAFSVVVSSAIVIPAVFSIALPDVFALPKTILMTAEATGSVLFWMVLGVGAAHASTNAWPDVPASEEDRARRPGAHRGVA